MKTKHKTHKLLASPSFYTYTSISFIHQQFC